MANAKLIASAPDLLAERDRLKAANAELAAALEVYMQSVNGIQAAMKDGVNVYGAISALISSEDMARAALTKHHESQQ